ncbi:CxxxxCH/CxxCH domain c-type cytochrome [Geomobilimonas luticola]|uniref:CxxxxCH/CxxCH domain-containing protein n=1 Tax=Geomobilimonas luticola TaxID=1114878 RepID=A0ABS5SA64_9BACT|nr:CxxxxCH/CxxCH domain-containing protein [Geomobilimonas luticola]MBT0652040.1 CxxxxCH/CxxCH domain-containing protein [Geomobilimonas luticola]
MGKTLKRKLRGMNLAAKIGLVVGMTLLTTLFMYGKWVDALNQSPNSSFETAGATADLAQNWTEGGTSSAGGTKTFQRNTTAGTGANGSYWYYGQWNGTANNQATNITLTSANITTPAYATNAILRGSYKRDYKAAVDSSSIALELWQGAALVSGSTTTLYTISNPGTGVTDAAWQGPVDTATSFPLAASTAYNVLVRWQCQTDNTEWGGGAVDAVYLNISPGNLAATANATTPKNADLTWLNQNPSTGSPALHATTPYKIYRDTTSNPGTRTFLANTTTLSYSDTATTGNTTYYYAVTNLDTNSFESPYSPEVALLTKPDVPGTPSYTSVADTSLTVNWTAPTGGAATYDVYRAPDNAGAPGAFALVGADVAALSYGDSGLAPTTKYWYRVVAKNVSGSGPNSADNSVTTATPVNNFTTPGVATASAASTTTISVSMPYGDDQNASNTYTVDYKLSSSGSWSNWVTNASHSASPYSTTVTSLTPGESYDVRMTYNDADGFSGANPQIQTVNGILLPGGGVNGTTAGTATAVQASSTSISVTMPYTDDINGNNTYLVEYQQGAGPFIVWPPNPQGHTASPFTTTITGLTVGQTYTVRVTYQDAEGIVGGTAVQTLAPVTLVSWTDSNLVHNSNRFPGTTKWGGSWGIPGGQYGAFDCKTCHIAGSSNIKRVRTSVTAPSGSFPGGAVVFNSMTSFGNDTGGHTASLHICEACHSQNKYHNFDTTNNTGGLAHENNSDCTTCHPHNAGFRAGCDVCHGNPPTTADNDGSTATGLAWKPAATGATSPGAHNMHAIARGMKCVTCHNGNTMPTVSNTIQMGFAMDKTNVPGFSGTKVGGSYDGFVPAAPYSFVSGDGGTTTVTQAGSNSCSNLYCHGGWTGSNGSITTPSWTGGATQAACGTCHGTTAATAPTAGSHGRHAANGAGQLALLCSSCHGTDPANNNHVNGRIYWNLATGDNRFGASATYKTFANSSTAALAPYGSCTVYCHSSVQNATGSAVASPTTSAVWGTAAPLSCDTSNCHGNPPAGGKHSIHAAYSYACATCHSGAGNETAKHADYKIDVAFSGLGTGGSYTQSAINPPGNGFGSCSTIYCHSSGQSADGLSATPVYAGTNPAWGGTAACGSCHATTTMTTGSHTQHLALDTNCGNCHTGASAAAYSDAAHVNQLIDVAGSYTLGGTPGNGYGTCSTAICHGTNSPVWGANTTNATCTKCHGKPTTVANYSTARAWQAAPGYGTTGKDVAGQTGTFTNGVSNDPQVGAHDAHLRTFNGYSDRQVLCTDCHAIPASGTHANGATDFAWSDLSKNIGTTGSVSSRGALVPTYVTGTCSTNYCHGGKLAGGSDTTPGWTETGYLTAYAKNATNCGKCHGAPPTAAPSTFAHTGIAIADDCAGCHNHNGSGPTHIDGTLYGAGNCDSCHDYDTVGATYAAGRWTGGTWGKNYLDGTVHEGWGAHAKHINYIKTRLSIATALDPAGQTYGLAGTNPEKVCGTCHSNDTGNHSMGGSTVRSINFGDGTFKMGGAAAGTSLLFGTTFPAQNPLYNGVSGTLSSTTAKTCSNLSCHYFTTPSW